MNIFHLSSPIIRSLSFSWLEKRIKKKNLFALKISQILRTHDYVPNDRFTDHSTNKDLLTRSGIVEFIDKTIFFLNYKLYGWITNKLINSRYLLFPFLKFYFFLSFYLFIFSFSLLIFFCGLFFLSFEMTMLSHRWLKYNYALFNNFEWILNVIIKLSALVLIIFKTIFLC